MANTEYGAVKLTTLTSIANSIRSKTGSLGLITPDEMSDEIDSISGEVQFLFDTNDLIADKYIANGGGAEVDYGGWKCTDYIPVVAGEDLNFATANVEGYNGWYDENKTWVSPFTPGTIMGGAGYGIVPVPTGVSFMRLSAANNIMEHTRVWR